MGKWWDGKLWRKSVRRGTAEFYFDINPRAESNSDEMSSEETPSSIVHRVNQLDAVRLDEELIELFRSQMFSSVRLLKVCASTMPKIDAGPLPLANTCLGFCAAFK